MMITVIFIKCLFSCNFVCKEGLDLKCMTAGVGRSGSILA